MNKLAGLNFFLGLILSSNLVVADGVKNNESGQQASADLTRRTASPASSLTSATEVPSATTSGRKHQTGLIATNALPPLPPGVTELKFSEFFRQPIGPRGLEYTAKLRALDGRRIRILGYMVRQATPTEHCFLLANHPITVNEAEYGLCDDLPASAVHVFTTADAPANTPFTPGPLLLTGTLRVGNRVETDGRVSAVRLFLDAPSAEQRLAAVQAAEAFAHQPDPHAGHHH